MAKIKLLLVEQTETCSNQIKDSDLSLCTHIVLQLEVPIKEIEDIIFRAKAAGCKNHSKLRSSKCNSTNRDRALRLFDNE